MRWWPWRRRWTIAVVGQESGITTPMTFIRFRTKDQAERMADELNAKFLGEDPEPLVRYEPVPMA